MTEIELAKPCKEQEEWRMPGNDYDDFFVVDEVLAERKQWQAALDKEKKRADELEHKLQWYKEERIRLQTIEQSADRVFSDGVNGTRKRAEKAEAKLKEVADEIEKIAEKVYRFGERDNLLEVVKKMRG